MENKNALTKEQQAFLEENYRKLKEKELFLKLSEHGPEADEKAFAEYVSFLASKAETAVFGQNVSEEELAGTSGGICGLNGTDCGAPSAEQIHHCITDWSRSIYDGGFPNCAKSVEDGSWCGSNDACYIYDVQYYDMQGCKKAWR